MLTSALPEWLAGSKPARFWIFAILRRMSGIFCTDWVNALEVNSPTIRSSPVTLPSSKILTPM